MFSCCITTNASLKSSTLRTPAGTSVTYNHQAASSVACSQMALTAEVGLKSTTMRAPGKDSNNESSDEPGGCEMTLVPITLPLTAHWAGLYPTLSPRSSSSCGTARQSSRDWITHRGGPSFALEDIVAAHEAVESSDDTQYRLVVCADE